MNEKEYAFWIAGCRYAGFATAGKLIKVFGSLENAFRADENEILAAGLYSRKAAREIISSRDENKIMKKIQELEKKNIKFTYYGSSDYPEKLENIDNPPFGLFYRGKLPDSRAHSVAVVGARSCSHEGAETARKMSVLMAGHGIQVISGLARGIDAASHRGALQAPGGKTFAVLGCGADICYPAQNISLYTEIQENGGILSEFIPGTAPTPSNFPRRNRIISGLSEGVLVIEAGLKSGSIITAETAASQGKDVYAVPGSIFSDLHKGTNKLIQDGACLVTGIRDILDALGIFSDDDLMKRRNEIMSILDGADRMVYSIMTLDPVHINQITGRTGLELSQVYSSLERLSARGFIRQTGMSRYALTL